MSFLGDQFFRFTKMLWVGVIQEMHDNWFNIILNIVTKNVTTTSMMNYHTDETSSYKTNTCVFSIITCMHNTHWWYAKLAQPRGDRAEFRVIAGMAQWNFLFFCLFKWRLSTPFTPTPSGFANVLNNHFYQEWTVAHNTCIKNLYRLLSRDVDKLSSNFVFYLSIKLSPQSLHKEEYGRWIYLLIRTQ